jgi:hypothetical protein
MDDNRTLFGFGCELPAEGALSEAGWTFFRDGHLRLRGDGPLPRLELVGDRYGRGIAKRNAWLSDKCIAYAKAHHHPELTDHRIWDVFETERPQLVPYAGRFDGFHAVPASISKTCLVRFDNKKYSVAASAVGRPVEVHAYADRVSRPGVGKAHGGLDGLWRRLRRDVTRVKHKGLRHHMAAYFRRNCLAPYVITI